jgi:hypothetical protein
LQKKKVLIGTDEGCYAVETLQSWVSQFVVFLSISIPDDHAVQLLRSEELGNEREMDLVFIDFGDCVLNLPALVVSIVPIFFGSEGIRERRFSPSGRMAWPGMPKTEETPTQIERFMYHS